MAWGTPTSRGTATDTAAPTSLPIASVTVAAGSLILVAGAIALDTPTITVSDSAGNTYTVIQSNNTQRSPDQVAFLAFAYAAFALAAGTVTVAWGGAGINSALAEVFEVTGSKSVSVEDADARATAANLASTPSPTTTSGTPDYAGDLFVAVDVTASTSTTWTEDTGNGWATLRGKTLSVASDDMALAVSYQVNAGTGQLTWAPTTANATHAKIIAAFRVRVDTSLDVDPATLTWEGQEVGQSLYVAPIVVPSPGYDAEPGYIETAFVKSYGGEVLTGGPHPAALPAFSLNLPSREEIIAKRKADKEAARKRWPGWHEPTPSKPRFR